MNNTKLTQRQQKLLIWMAEFKHANQRPATIKEIAENFKVSTTAIYLSLDSIKRRKITF